MEVGLRGSSGGPDEGGSEMWSGVRRAGIEGPRTLLLGLVLCICHEVLQWGKWLLLKGAMGRDRHFLTVHK